MKSILTNISKVINVIKRDGLKGVLRGFFLVFHPIGRGDVLLITGGVGDSARYRAFHVAEELNLHGIRASVAVKNNPFLSGCAKKFKVFVFHRLLVDGKIKKLIADIKAQDKTVIFDADDLLFDPEYIVATDYFKNISSLEKKLYEDGLGREILMDEYVKVCTTSTSFLADKLRAKNKQVFLVPNKLSNEDLEIADAIIKNKVVRNDDNVRIGYFSGTLSHNRDFATITDALMEIMERHANVKLVLAGPLDIENKLNKFTDRIERLAFVPRAKNFENISEVDINLSPVEIGDPFCESKSELKFSAAGILEVPTIASATRTFREAISDGVDGFVADGTQEWVEKLEQLITDKEFRINMGKLARDKSLAKFTNRNSHNEDYYNFLRSKIK